ncbi:MAG: hypothetical protein AB1641_09330 [Thermodesulfobacteriota bacterium]
MPPNLSLKPMNGEADKKGRRSRLFWMAFGLLGVGLAVGPPLAWALEVTSDIYRYRGYEMSTGQYEDYEVRPERARQYIQVPELRRGILAFGPGAAQVRVRTRLSDSHLNVKYYELKTCVACHVKEARSNSHVVRANLTCRQCHGGEPMASLQHYYSLMNPIRRHAYVCAKCHEGAGASFASYVVHEPVPGAGSTLTTFPALFYVFWFMIVLAVGTFLVFLPHTLLWAVRELLARKGVTA